MCKSASSTVYLMKSKYRSRITDETRVSRLKAYPVQKTHQISRVYKDTMPITQSSLYQLLMEKY